MVDQDGARRPPGQFVVGHELQGETDEPGRLRVVPPVVVDLAAELEVAGPEVLPDGRMAGPEGERALQQCHRPGVVLAVLCQQVPDAAQGRVGDLLVERVQSGAGGRRPGEAVQRGRPLPVLVQLPRLAGQHLGEQGGRLLPRLARQCRGGLLVQALLQQDVLDAER